MIAETPRPRVRGLTTDDAEFILGLVNQPLFLANMLKHPRFGRVIGLVGIVTGAALLGFNLSTFPHPPAEAGSLDLGPVLGLWGLVVTIMMARSIGWLKDQGLQTD